MAKSSDIENRDYSPKKSRAAGILAGLNKAKEAESKMYDSPKPKGQKYDVVSKKPGDKYAKRTVGHAPGKGTGFGSRTVAVGDRFEGKSKPKKGETRNAWMRFTDGKGRLDK